MIRSLPLAIVAMGMALSLAGCSDDVDTKAASSTVKIPTFASSTTLTTALPSTATATTSVTVDETVTVTTTTPPPVVSTVTKRHTVTVTPPTDTPAKPPKPPAAIVQVPPPQAVAIPLSAACKWAYHGRASGQWSGGVYSVVCFGHDGGGLGGFNDDSGHSLNDWCANPANTQGVDLRQAKSRDGTAQGWECVPVS
jgi:hypothetical protein